MTKPSGWISACALLLGLLAACGGEKKAAAKGTTANKDTTANKETTANLAVTGMARASLVPPPGAPGSLQKPLTQYTGDEFYTLAHSLTYTGGAEAQRRCRGQAACRGPNPTMHTRVRVDAVSGEDSLSAPTLPANGVIAVRALNRGQAADSMYNTQPGSQYEYYLIVTPTSPSTANWSLEELTTTPARRSHRTVSSGSFKQCGHPFVRGARADFKTCSQAALMHKAAFTLLPQSGVGDAPIWFACAEGCCTADTPTNS